MLVYFQFFGKIVDNYLIIYIDKMKKFILMRIRLLGYTIHSNPKQN